MKPFLIAAVFVWTVLKTEPARSQQYSVTEIVTDFGGYWKSGVGAINSTKPNNSHNVLSFTYNNVRYSTGANDSLLTAKGLTYSIADFRALPMESITGAVNGNTKIGLGEMYDGVTNGPSNPRPINSIPKYLQDGLKGLDIGTCVANLPAGTMNFPVTSLKSAAVGDGVPDLLITQTADPSATGLDRYEFTDINGNRVGNAVDIVLINILPVGNWTADFYDANTNPMNLQGGYTKTDRAIRLWAADFSAFGINSGNISRVAYFRITLNGNSDVAFVAYNNNTVDVYGNLLPINMQSFTATAQKESAILNWKTTSEINSARFVIETSKDGSNFTATDSIAAAGNSHTVRNYQYQLKGLSAGKWYLRLKMVDQNGYSNYSSIQVIQLESGKANIVAYPNPTHNVTTLKHTIATGKETIELYSLSGAFIKNYRVQTGSLQTTLDLSSIANGMYQVRIVNGSSIQSALITVQ